MEYANGDCDKNMWWHLADDKSTKEEWKCNEDADRAMVLPFAVLESTGELVGALMAAPVPLALALSGVQGFTF